MHHDGLDSADDAVLLAQLNVGSKSAFDVLYNRHWELVYRSAYKRLNDAEKAQDVAQDVFVQLWIRGNKSLIENLPAYLLVSARNGVFKVMEKEARHIDIPVDSAPEIESLFDRADAGIHRGSQSERPSCEWTDPGDLQRSAKHPAFQPPSVPALRAVGPPACVGTRGKQRVNAVFAPSDT
ncbi:MAG: hypothetical protein EOO88_58355, partial [Pedobacter sp.]